MTDADSFSRQFDTEVFIPPAVLSDANASVRASVEKALSRENIASVLPREDLFSSVAVPDTDEFAARDFGGGDEFVVEMPSVSEVNADLAKVDADIDSMERKRTDKTRIVFFVLFVIIAEATLVVYLLSQ